MSQATFEFFDRFENAGSDEAFADELARLNEMLWERIQKEELVIYRLFDRLGSDSGVDGDDDGDERPAHPRRAAPHADADDHKALFDFRGYLTEEILVSAGHAIRQAMKLSEVNRRTQNKLFYIFVEQAQNIIRYSADILSGADGEETELRHGALSVGRSDGRYYARSVNRVEGQHVQRLTEYLDLIKTLDEAAFKALYKQTLRGEIPEGSKGAHVGFIEMVRRSEGGFDFAFERDEDGELTFSVTAFV